MTMSCIDSVQSEIESHLKEQLTPKRYEHTIGVRDTALKLAEHYGCDKDKAVTAALLHDVARDLQNDELFQLIKQYDPGAVFSDQELENPVLLHGRAGAVVARTRFSVGDREILRSIELHTAGAPGMTLLERIIFVADFIEPGRSMKGVREARRLAYLDLDGAMLSILKSIFRYLLEETRCILPEAVEAYNELIMKRGE